MNYARKIPFNRIFFLIIVLLPAVLIQFFPKISIMDWSKVLIQTHLVLFLCILLLLKSVATLYPPLPGSIATLGSVPFIGWELAYVIEIVGSVIGASCSFFLGKRFGVVVFSKILGSTITQRLTSIHLKNRNQIEASIFFRFAFGGILSDGIAWGAPIIGFQYVPFIIGHVISHIVTTLPVFYIISLSVSSYMGFFALLLMVIAWLIIYRFKGRYFE